MRSVNNLSQVPKERTSRVQPTALLRIRPPIPPLLQLTKQQSQFHVQRMVQPSSFNPSNLAKTSNHLYTTYLVVCVGSLSLPETTELPLSPNASPSSRPFQLSAKHLWPTELPKNLYGKTFLLTLSNFSNQHSSRPTKLSHSISHQLATSLPKQSQWISWTTGEIHNPLAHS